MNQNALGLKTWGKDWWCCFSGAKCSDAFLFKKLLRNTFDRLVWIILITSAKDTDVVVLDGLEMLKDADSNQLFI